MVQQVARAEAPPKAADHTLAEFLDGLGREWTIIRGCRLRPGEGGDPPTVLIHPGRGVAVLDVPPSETPDAVGGVRAKLDEARFEAIFAGHLPVVHVRAVSRQVVSLPKLLDDAFAALPPLDLPGGDAWAGVVARTLLAEQQPVPSRRAAPRPPRASPDGDRPWRTRRPRRRGRALRKAVAVLICLTALAGVLAVAVNGVTAPKALVRAAESPAAVAVPAITVPAAAPLQPEGARPPLGLAVPTARPAPDAFPLAPVPDAGGAAAARPEARPPMPLPPEAPAPAASQRAAPPPPRRPEAPPPQAGRPPPDRAAPAQQQRRQPPQDVGAADPPPGSGGLAGEAAAQRCGRIAARVGSGAPLGEADMRFFNEACIRW